MRQMQPESDTDKQPKQDDDANKDQLNEMYLKQKMFQKMMNDQQNPLQEANLEKGAELQMQ
jgi:hypothetical protein